MVQALKGGKLYEVAVPFLADGRVQGAVVAVCGRAGLGRLVKKAPDIAAKVSAGAPAPALVRAARQRYLSGLIYRLAGDPDRALQEWKAASSLAPDDPDVAEVLRRAGYKPVPEDAKSCAAAYDQQRYDQAFIACRACLKRDPSNRTCAAGKKFQPRMSWVPWDRISEHLKHAVFIAEDDMFYRHQGVDWESVKAALQKDWEMKRLAYGGSTITQQVARNLYLSPSKNPLRKLKELLIARRLEKVLGKRRIFEIYLNIAEWGKGIYGAEAAAQSYFGKPAADLEPDEAVAMAVVLPNPRLCNPAKKGRYVERNMRRVMGRMRASGFLPDEARIQDGEEIKLDAAGLEAKP